MAKREEGCGPEIDGIWWIRAVLKTICTPSKGENGLVKGRGKCVCVKGAYSVKGDDIALGLPASPAAAELF